VSDPFPRILIVRLSAIGDVLHGLPVLNALRDHYPNAHLSWAVEGRAGDLLMGHKALDRLVILPRGWLKSPREVLRVRRELHAVRPDVAVDLQCLARSAIAARLSGARVRVGFDGRDGRELSRWVHNTLVMPTAKHVIDRNLELLRPLGVERPAARFDLPEPDAEAAAVGAFLKVCAFPGPFVVINPGAGWPSKRWPVDRYAAVARQLGERKKVPSVVVWAGNEEKEWAERIFHDAGGQAHLSPPTTLRELAALVRRAKLFLGSDTGPLHLAAAVGTPCVGLYGPMPAERNGPYGPGHIALQKVHLTGRGRRKADNAAMKAIEVEEVVAACASILDRPPARQSA
jgi:lipopolysaccharide heptosyltransferase I